MAAFPEVLAFLAGDGRAALRVEMDAAGGATEAFRLAVDAFRLTMQAEQLIDLYIKDLTLFGRLHSKFRSFRAGEKGSGNLSHSLSQREWGEDGSNSPGIKLRSGGIHWT
jgi:hypothetical protein